MKWPAMCSAAAAVLPILCLTFAVPAAAAAATVEKPNIILIFVDDLGWKDVGYHGSDFHETPHIDRLAKEGMVFSAGYSGAGNCQPSRACLLSGQYAPRHEVYAVGTTERGPRQLMRLLPVPNVGTLRREDVSMAGALKAAGYVTGIFGKWHLGSSPATQPDHYGFDVLHEVKHGWGGETVTDNPKGVYSLTQGVIKFMEQNRDRPFFAKLSHFAPHTVYQARAETLAKFKAKQPGQEHNNALYAACVYDLDDSVGILMRKIAELGLDRKTLVVFTSDNGSNMSCEPLRGKKGSYYDGGVRVPFIVRWPGVVQPGSRSDVPVVNQDLYPTFLEVAGGAVPRGKTLDGESIAPLFRQTGALRRQAIYWHFPGYLDGPVPRGRDERFRTRPVTVMNKGGWKLHLYHEEWMLDGGRGRVPANNAIELYNLNEDIGERRNLAVTHPAKRDELLGDMLAWIQSSGAKLAAERNPDYAPDRPLPPKQPKQEKAK